MRRQSSCQHLHTSLCLHDVLLLMSPPAGPSCCAVPHTHRAHRAWRPGGWCAGAGDIHHQEDAAEQRVGIIVSDKLPGQGGVLLTTFPIRGRGELPRKRMPHPLNVRLALIPPPPNPPRCAPRLLPCLHVLSSCSPSIVMRGDPWKQVETGRVGLEDASTGKHSWLWHVAQVGGWVGEGVEATSLSPQWEGALHAPLTWFGC